MNLSLFDYSIEMAHSRLVARSDSYIALTQAGSEWGYSRFYRLIRLARGAVKVMDLLSTCRSSIRSVPKAKDIALIHAIILDKSLDNTPLATDSYSPL